MPDTSAKINEQRLFGFQALRLLLPWINIKPGRHSRLLASHELVKVVEELRLSRVPRESREVGIPSFLKRGIRGAGDILIMILRQEVREDLEDRADDIETASC